MPLDTLGIDASRAAAGQRTGTEWYSDQIIRALLHIQDRPRIRLYHRSPNASSTYEADENIVLVSKRFWTHRALNREQRRNPADALFVPAHVLPRNHPPAAVVTIHDLGYRHEPDAHTIRRRVMLDLTTRWNAWRANRIIVPSAATRDDLQREYGVAPERVDIVPHGVDTTRFHQLPPDTIQASLSRLGVKQPYLLFVSTIQPRKNLTRLIEAFESLGRSDIQLVIAGGAGWKSGPIVERIRTSSRGSAIHWLGYVADEHLPALYNGASAFAFPSLYEGFGMGVLEAMACGCPVVTSNTSSLPEVAGDAALLVDPHSVTSIQLGLERALDLGTAKVLAKRGEKHVAQFTWDRAAWLTLASIRRAYAEAGG